MNALFKLVLLSFLSIHIAFLHGMWVGRTGRRVVLPPVASPAPAAAATARVAAYRQAARSQGEQTPTFGGATQARIYRTSPITATRHNEPQTGWGWLSSWFKPNPQDLFDNFSEMLRFGDWKTPNGKIYGGLLFNDNDLEQMKKMIDNNLDFINEPINGRIHVSKSSLNSVASTVTLVDFIFEMIYSVNNNPLSQEELFAASKMKENFAKLFEYMIKRGARICIELAQTYLDGCKFIMLSIDKMYEGKSVYGDPDYEIAAAQNILERLIPILKNLIPKYQREFDAIQKKLAGIKKDPEGYKIKMQDKKNKEEYMDALRGEFLKRGESKMNAKFDEEEYREWLRNGKRFKTFGHQKSYQSSGKRERKTDLLTMLKERVKLSQNPKLTEVNAAWRKYSMLIHPDLTPDPVEKKRRTAEIQLLNNLHDEYLKRHE